MRDRERTREMNIIHRETSKFLSETSAVKLELAAWQKPTTGYTQTAHDSRINLCFEAGWPHSWVEDWITQDILALCPLQGDTVE